MLLLLLPNQKGALCSKQIAPSFCLRVSRQPGLFPLRLPIQGISYRYPNILAYLAVTVKRLPSAFQPHSVELHLSQEPRHSLYTFIAPPGANLKGDNVSLRCGRAQIFDNLTKGNISVKIAVNLIIE